MKLCFHELPLQRFSPPTSAFHCLIQVQLRPLCLWQHGHKEEAGLGFFFHFRVYVGALKSGISGVACVPTPVSDSDVLRSLVNTDESQHVRRSNCMGSCLFGGFNKLKGCSELWDQRLDGAGLL